MGHKTDKRLEHAEHTQHHAHDPFDRRVAMSMAIIAAVLAGVTLLSHRGHTDVLRLQSEANSIQTEAARYQTQSNIYHTKASDAWAYYQAQNIRSHEFQAYLRMADIFARHPGSEKAQEDAKTYWTSQVVKYEGEPGPDGKGRTGGSLEVRKAEATGLENQGKEYQAKASETLKEAANVTNESHHVHHAVNYIDVGHLGIEFALVLCSVAVLTKQRSFWMMGILVAVAGAAVAGIGIFQLFFVAPHH